MIKRKVSRRSSVQYCVSAEEHVENEVKHERLLTETSKLSSSWASLNLSGNEKSESGCSSSSVSANNSPTHRPNNFSGPLVISVTCSSLFSGSSNFYATLNGNRRTPTSPTPHFSSGHASPVASPVSSRVQCYSPGLTSTASSPTSRRPTPGSASPLLLSTTLSRKRGYFPSIIAGGGSSDDASREGSPDPFSSFRINKFMRHSDGKGVSVEHFRWPPGPPTISNPPSPSCHLFSATDNGTTASSPSTSSLPSPRLSFTASSATVSQSLSSESKADPPDQFRAAQSTSSIVTLDTSAIRDISTTVSS